MLAITPKQSIPNIDMYNGLYQYIKNAYNKTEAKNVESVLRQIHDARNRHVMDVGKRDFSPNCIENTIDYYKMLDVVSSRFPFGRHQGSSFFRKSADTVKVAFTWYDTFRPEKKATEFDAQFEKTVVLFNIGAFYSLSGIREDRTLQSGLTAAYKKFQKAAGIFTYLATNMQYESAMTIDLSVNSYKMISHLMLAQAQACYFELAVQKKMSASLVAKLAAGIAALFQHATNAAKSGALDNWINRSSYTWIAHYKFQQLCFTAASNYWQSQACLKDDKYGEEIAYLYKAKDIVDEASKLERNLVESVRKSREKLRELILTRLKAAIKDNETIYYASVPKSENLEIIEEKFVVKSEAFIPPSGHEIEKVFTNLVPTKIKENAELYQKQLQSALVEITNEVDETNTLVATTLSSLNLPGALEAVETNSGFPQKLINNIIEVQKKGGLKALDTLANQVYSRSMDAKQGLNEIYEMLSKEASEDEALRTQWPNQWNRCSSQQIAAAFYRDADTVKQYLDSASASDEKIMQEIGKHRHSLGILDLSIEQLNAKLPKTQPSGMNNTSPAAQNLRNILNNITQSQQKLVNCLAEFENEIKNDDITSSLQKNIDKNNELIYADERKKHSQRQEDIANELDSLKAILTTVNDAFNAFKSSQDNNPNINERQNVIQNVNVAVDKYNKLTSNLNEGFKFYADIIRDYLVPLKQTVSDFVMARQQEKQIILEQITADLARYNINQNNNSSNNNNNPIATGAYQAIPAANPNLYPDQNNKLYGNIMQNQANASSSLQPLPTQTIPPPQTQQILSPTSSSLYSRPVVSLAHGNVDQPMVDAEKKEKEWSCSRCTFLNKNSDRRCQMCDSENPQKVNDPPREDKGNMYSETEKVPSWRKFFSSS